MHNACLVRCFDRYRLHDERLESVCREVLFGSKIDPLQELKCLC